MSQLLPKFISFRPLGFKSSAHNLPEGREAENPRNVEPAGEVNTAAAGETFSSPTKVISALQSAPFAAEVVGARVGDNDRDLTTGEKVCV